MSDTIAFAYATYMQDVLGLQVVPLWGRRVGEAGTICRCAQGAECQSPCKHPRGRYKDKPSRLPNAGDNYAVVLGRYVVVDVDDRTVLDNLHDVIGFALPDTWSVDTARGRHYWFVADRPLRTRIGAWPKVDVKSGATYVVGAGSVSVNGAVYEPINTLPIAPCPQRIVDLCGLYRSGTPVLHRTDNRTTSKFARESLTLLLDEMRSATERNTTLHKLTCRMLRSGIYFDDAIAELASVALDTGLDPHEVARTIESARRTVTQ